MAEQIAPGAHGADLHSLVLRQLGDVAVRGELGGGVGLLGLLGGLLNFLHNKSP